MDYQKALSILGLKSGFTEAELKKAWRRLSHENHPDNPKNVQSQSNEEAIRKQADINVAYEFLSNYAKKSQPNYNTYNYNQQTQYQNTFNIYEYRKKKYKELKDIIDFDFNEYQVSETIKYIINDMTNIPFNFSFASDTMENKQDVDNAFNNCLQNIKNLFKKLKETFYKENGLNEINIEETIDYNCTLKEFYKQLLNIKDKYSPQIMINKKYKELKRIVNFDLNEYKLSENIKNIIGKIKNVPENFNLTSQMSSNKYFIENLFTVNIDTIKDYFKKLETEFYKETDIDKYKVEETINYDCTLKEFYKQLLKIREKYSKEGIINNKLEEEISKYTSYDGYERIKVLVRYCKTKTLNKIKQNNFEYTQKDIEDMHKSILEKFYKYYLLEQKISELEDIISKIDNQEIKYEFTKIKNKFKTTVKFEDIETAIKELEKLLNKYVNKKETETNFKNTELNKIYTDLITRYSETLKGYNLVTQYAAVGNLNDFLNEVLKLFKQGIDEGKQIDFFNMFNEITFKNLANDNKIIENITKVLNSNKSNIYIKTKHTNIFDDASFFYLNEESMLMYKIEPHNRISGISSKKITQNDLKQEYISLEEFLDKSTFIGENKVDENWYKCAIIYQKQNYSIYIGDYQIYDHQFCIGYNKTFHKSPFRQNNHNLNEYKDKEHLISLIKEQIKKRFEEELEKKENQQSSKPTLYHSYDFGNIFNEETQYNTDDTYGYNGPKRR